MASELPAELKPAAKVKVQRKHRNENGKCLTPKCRRKATEAGSVGSFDNGRPSWCAEHYAALAEIATDLEGEGKKISRAPTPAAVKITRVEPAPRRKLSDGELRDAAYALVSAAEGEAVSRSDLALRLAVSVPKLERVLADDARLAFGARGVSLPDAELAIA